MTNVYAVPFISRPMIGAVTVPGSKSITNRVLPIAALADGVTEIRGALFSDDSRYFAGCLQTLGYHLEVDEMHARMWVRGAGTAPLQSTVDVELFVGNSGTTARFITAMVALGRGRYTVDGVERMRQRPIGDLLTALQSLGCTASDTLGTGCPPVRVAAKGLRGGEVVVRGQDSSQFVTALLLAAPYASDQVIVRVEGDLVSKPYVDMTVRMMREFGAVVQTEGQVFTIQPSHYSARVYAVEPDASGASYFLALPAICGGAVTVTGMRLDSMQGDAQFARILAQMGCEVSESADGVTVSGPPDGVLQGISVDLFDMSDTVPTLAAIAPFASGPVHIFNVANVRLKETDRIAACVTELRRLGVTVDEHADGLTVHPCAPSAFLSGITVQTYDDHRMAMAFSILGLRVRGTQIADPQCVNKTFPDFFVCLDQLLQNNQ